MKHIVVILISLFSNYSHAEMEPDKKQHLIVSAGISSLLYLGFRKGGVNKSEAYMGAVTTTLAIGLIKEITDPVFDNQDLAYDAVGAFVAPLLFISF